MSNYRTASWSLGALALLTGLMLLVCSSSALPSVPNSKSNGSNNNKNKRYVEEFGGSTYDVFEHAATGVKLSVVANSGICETTAGVAQYSGYMSVGPNMNMWFWFFAARKSPSTAPLALWLNGGPGCSSMIGLFQENGPCQFYNGSNSPSLNPHSFNTYANILYVDQPIGTGFSYGTDDVNSTVTAAPYVWNLLQAFFAAYPTYQSRDFGLFTESYGGHYGPEFASYFESQNTAIDAAAAKAEAAGHETRQQGQAQKVKLVALGVNNGWYDARIQYKAYIDYAANNTYRQLIPPSQYSSYVDTYNSQCLPAISKCKTLASDNSDCSNGDNACYNNVEAPLEQIADFDSYDIRAPSHDPNPPETYVNYLRSSSVMRAIGAQSTYSECPNAPYDKFASTGDSARSFVSQLSSVVQSGVTVMIWAGDADWICNWMGGLEVINTVNYSGTSQFGLAAVKPYTVDGVQYGEYKSVGNLSWLRVYAAGHEVPFYQPQVALQAFWQTLQKQPLSPT